jgi:hypothetical protein
VSSLVDKSALPNGNAAPGLLVMRDGAVRILCEDGQHRVVHPAVVDSFASGHIPSGVWATAQAQRNSVLVLPGNIKIEFDKQ